MENKGNPTQRPRTADDYAMIDGKPVRKSELMARGLVPLESGEWVPADKARELEQRPTSAPDQRQPTPVSQFTLTRVSDLLAEPAEDIGYVWEDTLPQGGHSMLVAKPKSGKSTFARNLAVRIARGDVDFLGRRISLSGPVVYLALEEKRSEVKKHFSLMGAAELPIYIHTGSAPQQAVEELRRAILQCRAVFAIVDPLQRLARIRDLNDYASVSLALEPITEIARETGCHIMLIHHANKGIGREGGDCVLGSTALFGGVDCVLIMKRTESYRSIESIQRYGSDLTKTVVSMDPGTGVIDSAGRLEDYEVSRCEQSILGLLPDHGRISEIDLKASLPTGRYGQGLTSRALRKLVEEGKAARHGGGRRGDPYLYSKSGPGDSRFSGCNNMDTPTKPTFWPERESGQIPSRNSGCAESTVTEETGGIRTPRNQVAGPDGSDGCAAVEGDVGEI